MPIYYDSGMKKYQKEAWWAYCNAPGFRYNILNLEGYIMDRKTPYKELHITDNFLFGEVMRDAEISKLFLEALLGKPIAEVKFISKAATLSS